MMLKVMAYTILEYFFQENKTWYFMWIVYQADNLHKMSSIIFYVKEFRMSSTTILKVNLIFDIHWTNSKYNKSTIFPSK